MSASTVKITSATQTRPKPIQRLAGMSSWKTRMPRANWMVGARYCSSPSETIETRIAAAPKSMRGTAVIRPVVVKRRACPTPLLPKLEALRAVKERDGILPAEQIRRAIDLWLDQKGVTKKTDRKRAASRTGSGRD